MGWVVKTMPRSLPTPLGKNTRYPSCRRICGPHGRSGRLRKKSPPPGFHQLIVQPVGSLHTNWAITTQNNVTVLSELWLTIARKKGGGGVRTCWAPIKCKTVEIWWCSCSYCCCYCCSCCCSAQKYKSTEHTSPQTAVPQFSLQSPHTYAAHHTTHYTLHATFQLISTLFIQLLK